MKRCTRCILPETFPGITLNTKGICNYCRDYEPMRVLGEQELIKVLNKYRNKGDKYDCIAAISGGRDSSFAIHQIVKKYNMRTIALTVDSGFILPEGYRNIETTVKKLNVEHVFIKNEEEIEVAKQNTEIKFHGWLRKPSINTIVPVLNAGDKTMNLKMANFAKKNNIPLVIGGNIIGNCTIEQEHWKTGYMGVFPDEHGVYTTFDKFRLLFLFLLEYMRNPANFRLPILQEYIKGAGVYFFESIFRPKEVDTLGFYDYIYWDEKKILSTITDELDWQGAIDHTSTWRIDDSAYPLINYIYHQLVGFTEHDEMYSKMIREGQLTREKGLERCLKDHKSDWIHGPRMVGLLDELKVTKKQLDSALGRYRETLLKRI